MVFLPSLKIAHNKFEGADFGIAFIGPVCFSVTLDIPSMIALA